MRIVRVAAGNGVTGRPEDSTTCLAYFSHATYFLEGIGTGRPLTVTIRLLFFFEAASPRNMYEKLPIGKLHDNHADDRKQKHRPQRHLNLRSARISPMSVYTFLDSSPTSRRSDSTSMEARLAVVENKVGGIDELRKDVTELSKNVYTLIGEIRAERRSK